MAHAVADEPVLHMGPPLPNGKLAMWIFLATEIMFFTGLIGTYIVLRFGQPTEANPWPTPHDVHLIEALGAINTAVLIGPDGTLLGKYRKHKLEHELVRNTPGTETPIFRTPFGQIAIMICADRRDPDLVQRLARGGADLLICPSGGMFGPKTNDPIVQARSRENRLPIFFVHPAEFLVTAPGGKIITAELFGDRLLIDAADEGTSVDSGGVRYFDLPR